MSKQVELSAGGVLMDDDGRKLTVAALAPTGGTTGQIPTVQANGTIALATPSATSGTGLGRGYAIPAGALAEWKAAKALSASQRVEVVAFGDSTTYGAGGNYSWLQRVRDRAVAAGVTDGGKGLFGTNESAIGYDSPEVNGFVSKTGWAVGADASGVYGFNAEDFISNTAGDTLNLRGRGQEVEIIYTRRGGQTGEFTYAIDGGATTTVSAVPSGSTDVQRAVVPIGGAARDSLHTLQIVNRGGITAAPPTFTVGGVNSGGSWTTGTVKWYKVTAVFSGGETTPSAAQSGTVPPTASAGSLNISITVNGASSYKVYRSDTQFGTYELVPSCVDTGGSSSIRFYADNTYATSPGVTPPTVNTTNLNTSLPYSIVAAGFRNTNGIVLQKYARTGATMTEWFEGVGYKSGTSAWYDWKAQAALGLVQSASPVTVAPFGWGAAQAASPAPRPALAILHLGFNDMSNFPLRWRSATTYTANQLVGFAGGFWYAVAGSTNVKPGSDVTKWLPYDVSANYPLDLLSEGIQLFCRMARAAGASPVVVSGQFPLNAAALEWGGEVAAIVRSTALGCGAVWVDFMEALGAPNEWGTNGVASAGNPHLTKAGYQRQADFLWDNVLAAA